MLGQALRADTAVSSDKTLYKLGGVAAWMVALLTVSEVVLFALYPQPGTISDWFALFRSNRLLGLLDAWALEVPMYLMFIPVFLALRDLLGKANRGLVMLATVLALLGIGVFLATNNPVTMLSLSHQYTAATTDVDRSALIAAGQTVLANTNQRAVGGFNMGLFLVSVAGLILSSVMVRSRSFSKSTAYVGVLANALALVDYLRQMITSSPLIAVLVILPNALFLIGWYVMVGRRLYQLGR